MSWKTEFFGPQIQTKEGTVSTEEALADKELIAIYFSAHWCPPCRGFTPVLGEFYEELKKSKESSPGKLEIIFASSDSDQHSFDEYYASMPWVSLPFSSGSIKESLSTKYGVRGIPTLIILKGADGAVVDADGRSTVAGAKGNVSKALSKWG